MTQKKRSRVRRGNRSKADARNPEQIRKAILGWAADQPLNVEEAAQRLRLGGAERENLESLFQQMEKDGELARIRRNRYVVPKEADLFTGIIEVHPSGAAHVLSSKSGEPDLFVSAENTWTAMHGDRVVARIEREARRGGHSRQKQRSEGGRRLEGRVIRILERANDRIVGTLQRSKSFFYVVADDPKFVHNLYVPEPKGDLQARPGDKVVARMDSWPSRHVNPEGAVVEVLGAADAPGVDMLSIIRKHQLAETFPAHLQKEAEQLARAVRPEDCHNRVDLRDTFVFTIDPVDARDFDDAIMVEETRGGWKVWIHIADVSHYVRPESGLDQEAISRGNSVYLPDRVIPMLPEVLSNGICSLRPDEDRLAFSVEAEIGRDGTVHRTRFAKTVIRSRNRLTYQEALAILQKKKPAEGIEKQVHMAWALSSVLRKKRFAKGSLDLDFAEVKVYVDERGKPIRIERSENDISHQLIEELMLFANEAVAREMRRKKQATIYRVHEDPDPDRLAEYRELVLANGIKIGDLTQRDELGKLLRKIRGNPAEYALKIGLLKSLKRARYTPEPLGHYGLSKTDYLHFTSPIRRYADLVVHRSLARLLGLTQSGPDTRAMGQIAEHISNTERTAADAEREAVRLKKLEYFQIQIDERRGETFMARILEIRNYGMLVELPDFLISGLIHVSALEGDFFVFDPARGRFVGRKSKKVYRIGEEIEVLVDRVDMFKQQIDFRPA